jgi:type VI protein secretion system component Hcp
VAYYLQIPGIDGEVTDRDYAGWIDVESVKFGDPGDRGGGGSGGGGTGRINLTDVSLTKKWDKASGELMKATATGKHFPKVTLAGRARSTSSSSMSSKTVLSPPTPPASTKVSNTTTLS